MEEKGRNLQHQTLHAPTQGSRGEGKRRETSPDKDTECVNHLALAWFRSKSGPQPVWDGSHPVHFQHALCLVCSGEAAAVITSGCILRGGASVSTQPDVQSLFETTHRKTRGPVWLGMSRKWRRCARCLASRQSWSAGEMGEDCWISGCPAINHAVHAVQISAKVW